MTEHKGVFLVEEAFGALTYEIPRLYIARFNFSGEGEIYSSETIDGLAEIILGEMPQGLEQTKVSISSIEGKLKIANLDSYVELRPFNKNEMSYLVKKLKKEDVKSVHYRHNGVMNL